LGAQKALEFDSPVLLLEDDALFINGQHFNGIVYPDDADVLWLGRSVNEYEGIKTPQILEFDGNWARIIGTCQASHAIILCTTKAKRAWIKLCNESLQGKLPPHTDIAVSQGGHEIIKQYVSRYPYFYQPQYPETLIPL
jgi:hypothetical protein